MVITFGSSTSSSARQLVGRLAVPRELEPQPRAREERQLQLLLQVRCPTALVGDPLRAAPRSGRRRVGVEVVEVGAEVLVQVAGSGRPPSSGGGRRW